MATTVFTYADVILPLAVPGKFTYRIPDFLKGNLSIGQRVVVQFGSRKIYTALVFGLHNNPPELVKAKTILDILDESPIVLPAHLELWEWMAHYYMCTLGEVMNIALPQGLKLDSETHISLHPDWEPDQFELDDLEFIITNRLAEKEDLSISEIQKLAGKKTVQPIIKSLIQKNAVYAHEQLMEKYKPKLETYIKMAESLKDEEGVNDAFDALTRAPKQQEVLLTYLKMAEDKTEINKSDLIKESGASSGIVKQLVEKGFLTEYKKKVDRLALDISDSSLKSFHLSKTQHDALMLIEDQFTDHSVVLLHGVTSSGKTQLYIELINRMLSEGRQVLYLLPEIALTGQMVSRLREVYGDKIGVYHSKFSMNERVEIWQKVLSKEYRIVVGARSALFLPFISLGLIIVDEEHDPSFKQFDPAPRYQARDTAIYMAQKAGAKTLLGTATPSFESYRNVRSGKYGMVTIRERYGNVKLPQIEIVNMRDEMKKKKMKSLFTSVLLAEMKKALAAEEQVILFQNRRGFAPYMLCLDCSFVPKCKHCDVSLSYHKWIDKLKCHYCGFTSNIITSCEECGSHDLRILGFGTEKVEEEVTIFFPEAKVARLDYDATRTKESHTRIIEDFADRKINILVGTQMVTKGLDFDNVSLVGILSADQLLGFPDFRANERGFQLMEQVSGRAGRKEKQGKVVIQTFDPQHRVLDYVLKHDFEKLYSEEILYRKNFVYPPFCRLIQITLKHRKREVVVKAANVFAGHLNRQIQGKILGPATPTIGRIKNLYLQEMLVKMSRSLEVIQSNKKLIAGLIEKLHHNPEFRSVRFHVDVDP